MYLLQTPTILKIVIIDLYFQANNLDMAALSLVLVAINFVTPPCSKIINTQISGLVLEM